MGIETILLIYMIGGAISAFWFAWLGAYSSLSLRELLEIICLAWLLWPLILLEESFHSIRNYRRNRIARLRGQV